MQRKRHSPFRFQYLTCAIFRVVNTFMRRVCSAFYIMCTIYIHTQFSFITNGIWNTDFEHIPHVWHLLHTKVLYLKITFTYERISLLFMIFEMVACWFYIVECEVECIFYALDTNTLYNNVHRCLLHAFEWSPWTHKKQLLFFSRLYRILKK